MRAGVDDPTERRIRMGVLLSHPVQYFSPLFQKLSQCPRLDMLVYYGTTPVARDEQFGVDVRWDVPLFECYKSVILRNHAWRPRLATHFWGVVNWGLPAVLRRDRPDVLIIHGWAYFSYVLGFLAAKTLGIKVWLRTESPWNQQCQRGGWRGRLKRILLGALLVRRADCCLYVGAENRRFYEAMGVPGSKLVPTPYGVDNERFRVVHAELAPRRATIRREMGIPDDATVFLFMGKLIAKKRPLDLLQALGKVGPGAGRRHLLVVGDGELRLACEAYAGKHGLPVTFAGFRNQTEIGWYYTAADVLVLPSGTGETWGLVVNEAMNFDLPVVVSDLVGCAPDLCREGENGFQYPCGDINALAGKLRWMIDNPAERQAMGRRSSDIVAQYSYDWVVAGILQAAGTAA